MEASKAAAAAAEAAAAAAAAEAAAAAASLNYFMGSLKVCSSTKPGCMDNHR